MGERCSGGACVPEARDGGGLDAGGRDASGRDAEPGDAPWFPDATLDGDGGLPDSGVDCTPYDEATCPTIAGCVPAYCAGCGQPFFTGCRAATDPPVLCLALPCPICEGLVEAECLVRPDCVAHRCADCTGSAQFSSCGTLGGTPPPCARPICGCEVYADEMSCDADSRCHPVYSRVCEGDPNNPQCLMHFASCGNGATASCTGAPSCDALEPICEGETVVSYTTLCYEGCVRRTDCGP